MKLSIYKNFIFDIFLSFFFYIQILGINAQSSIFYWTTNSFIIIIVFLFIKKKINVEISKMWLFHVFISIWVITDILLLITDSLTIGLDYLSLGNLFLISFQLPILALIFYYFLCNDKSYFTFSFFSIFITLLLFLGWMFGFIVSWKYQIIGNIALVSFVLFQAPGLLKRKKKLLVNLVLIIIILIVGSRQSLFGIVLFLFIYVFSRLNKFFFKTSFTIITLCSIIYFIVPSNINLQKSFSQLNTIDRIISNSELEASSNNYRIEGAKMLINNFSFYPNGYAFTKDRDFLEPHNLFLEIIYLKGYFFGGILVIILSFCLLLSIFNYSDYKVVNTLIILLLIPAMVSAGLHAARFFIIGILVFLIIKSVGVNRKILC
jgi:hypothetical protein